MINRRKFINNSIKAGITGYTTLAGLSASANVLTSEDKKVGDSVQKSSRSNPDIIFLMTDQQRWDALGINNTHIKTPNLDKLVQQGILYQQAVCQAPMCVPSRNSMMLGLYPSQLGIRSNGSHSFSDNNLPATPLPEVFRRNGYQTAGFGKTHWGKTDEKIGTRGFEVRVVGAKEVGQEEGAIHYQDDENPAGLAAYKRETAAYGGGEEAVAGYIGCTSQVAERDHRDGWVAEKCLEFLKDGVDPNRPLFFYLSFLKPHAGLNVPKRFEDMYDINTIPDVQQPPWDKEPQTHLAWSDKANASQRTRYENWHEAWSKMTPMERRRTTLRYYANCSWLDDYFGRVLDRLRELGRLDNALIVFTSDHGDMLSERNFRFTKYCLYDSSVRVPLVLSGSVIPEKLRGLFDKRPAELVDIYPTLLSAAGINPGPTMAGDNLLAKEIKQGSFCEYHDSGTPAYMWRTPKWKLILFADQPLNVAKFQPEAVKGELYDLEKDPHEWDNLYNSPLVSKIREEMKTALVMHLAYVNSVFPVGKG